MHLPHRYDVLVVGRPTVDLVFTNIPSWPALGQEVYAEGFLVAAGGAFNMVAALHRLGFAVGMVGVVGNDPWSRLALSIMEAEGVSTELIRILPEPLPSVSVCMTYQGDRGFVSYEERRQVYEDAFRSHALAVIGRVEAPLLHAYLGPDLPLYKAEADRRGMRLTVATGWDEAWLKSSRIWELLPLPDLVFANEAEARAITGATDACAALRRLGEAARFVVLKRGADGSSAIVDGVEYHAPTQPVEVVDATGAGDCFNAGFLYGWRKGMSVTEALNLGNICGGLNVQRAGGYAGAPREAELIAAAEAAGITVPKRRHEK